MHVRPGVALEELLVMVSIGRQRCERLDRELSEHEVEDAQRRRVSAPGHLLSRCRRRHCEGAVSQSTTPDWRGSFPFGSVEDVLFEAVISEQDAVGLFVIPADDGYMEIGCTGCIR